MADIKKIKVGNIEYNIKDASAIHSINNIIPDENGNIITAYVHEQSTASANWVVQHNLGKKPSITVVDSADTVVVGAYEYINDNEVRLHFNSAFTGKAYLN